MMNYQKTMDNLLCNAIHAGEINGANVLMIHKGQELYRANYGYADKEQEVPMRHDTIFRLYSMTKPITAVAVMILAERGEIDLRDPVSYYLPCFCDQKVLMPDGSLVRANRDSTIWDMLHMSSGIPYPDPGHQSARDIDVIFRDAIARREAGERVDTQEYVRRIAQIPLMFHPGEKWMYGLSADILGAVVEVVSQKSYGKFLQDELFGPLAMEDTAFFVPESKKARFAQNYIWSSEEQKLVPFTKSHLGEYYGADVAFESGGAGLVSTISDYRNFATMLLGKGTFRANKILGVKTVEFMTKDHLTPAQKQDFNWDSLWGHGYSCLMRMVLDQGAAHTNAGIGEFGWDGWTGNFFAVSPADELILLYFIQRCDSGMTPLMRKLRMATYGAIS
ncbi:MAG: beta-lactamase family protein [Lachnospiraceae bacterium]|nr:beta-lactamase family protein [Lachnospiraceae bacterium]